MLYEYKCEDCGQIVERLRKVSQRNEVTICDYCEGACYRIVELPSERSRVVGEKIPGWMLKPDFSGNGPVIRDVEVNSTEEYKAVLKKNNLGYLETASDHLIQGGQSARDKVEAKRKAMDAEVKAFGKDYAHMKSNPSVARDVLKKALDKGKEARKLTDGR